MSTTSVHAHAPLAPADGQWLGRRARLPAGASVTYNVIEAAIAITAGVVAGSVALIGFGLDSIVEVSSGLIILWQFRHRMPETREQQALRLMAFSFWALAAFVSLESVRALVTGHDPESSPVGISLAVASLLVMPFLSWAQRRTGRQLGSAAVVADSTQTLLCTYLSAVLLAGLLLNATLGWSWADPIAGLVIAAIAAKEGREAWRGEGCCAPGAHSAHAATGEHSTGEMCAGAWTSAAHSNPMPAVSGSQSGPTSRRSPAEHVGGTASVGGSQKSERRHTAVREPLGVPSQVLETR